MKLTTPKIITRRGVCALVAAAAGAFAFGVRGEALAQTDFPTEPIRIIVGFAPGGSSDLTARQLAPKLEEYLGQPTVVENRVGANGRVGANAVATAEPDGHTLLVTTETSTIIAAHIGEPLPYEPLTDLEAVSLVLETGNVIVAHPSFEADSLEELLALAKENPGEYVYGHSGVGGSLHLAFELLKNAADVDIRGISYGAGSGAILPAVLSNEIPLMIGTVPAMEPHIESDALKPLGVTLPERSDALPDVPTAAESGVPGFGISSFIGVYAPAGTPDEIVQKIADAVQRAVKTPDLQKAFADRGQIPVGSEPEEFAAYLQRVDKVYAELGEQLENEQQ